MKYIVGAYATAPSLGVTDVNTERCFYERLIASISNIQGLEIPFWGDHIHCFGTDFLLDMIPSHWRNVLTCIPGTMSSLSNNPSFGLSSDDEFGRSNAISMHKRANDMLHRINDKFGCDSIIAVQITSAPSIENDGVSSSRDSFLKSMEELVSWDWGKAKLVVEHCDAFIFGKSSEKGFMSLEDEVYVLSSLSDVCNIGIIINWARSAIEGRSPDKPIEHLKMASEPGLLSGLIFSGVSGDDKIYGAWKDTHMPFAKYDKSKYFEQHSLLTEINILNTLKSIELNELDYLGIKLLSMPIETSSIERRVGLNEDAISTLEHIILNNI